MCCGQDFTTFQVSDVKVENVDALNKDLTTTYTVSADRFGKSMGTLLMVRPRVLGSEYLQTGSQERVVPINLRETMQATDEYEITLPPGYGVDEIPDPVQARHGICGVRELQQGEEQCAALQPHLHGSRGNSAAGEIWRPAEAGGVIAADEQSSAVLKKQ